MFGSDSVGSFDDMCRDARDGSEKGELLASRMLTSRALIGLTRLHSVARRGEPQAFHSGGGLSVEKVQHLDPC